MNQIGMNGQHYNGMQWTGSSGVVARTSASRTCIAKDAGETTAYGDIYTSTDCYLFGACDASDDANPQAWHLVICLNPESFTMSDGSSLTLATARFGAPSSVDLEALLTVTRSGLNYLVKLAVDGTTITLDTLTAANIGTFFTAEIWFFKDKCLAYWNGVHIDDRIYAVEKADMYLLEIHYDFDDEWNYAVDYWYMRLEENDFAETLGRSLTNLHPDNGTIRIIKHTAFDAAVGAGDAWECAVADGDWTPPAMGTGVEVLLAKTLDCGGSGFAAELTTTASGATEGWV